MFAIFFGMAYDRIWKGRAIKVWEWIFWVPILIVLGFRVYGYSLQTVDVPMFFLSWLFIQTAPAFIIPAWINIAHVSTGKLDESLRSIPMRPSEILLPRVFAVLVTAIQMFLPVCLALLANIKPFVDLYGAKDIGPELTSFAVFQVLGWMLFLVTWGITAGSISKRHSGNFFLLYFSPGVVVILVLIPLIMGGVILDFYDELYSYETVFGKLFEAIGIVGFVLSPILFGYACKKWGERTG